jgi:phosphomannomutase
MGAHPDAPAMALIGSQHRFLNDLIAAAADEILHPAVCAAFGKQLPFLFKILAAASPLSLQTHPTRRNAEEGFARENALGILPEARHRNYRDPNHKPELIAALTDFYGLRGFRPLPEIARQLEVVPEWGRIAANFRPDAESLRALYSHLMTLPQVTVDTLLTPLVERLATRHQTQPFTKADPEFWLLRSDSICSCGGHRDRGLFSFHLLNLVHLRPGEAMYLPAGILHAYLEGTGVELMANSNNVLRGGLTTKHIDVPELLRNLTFEGADAEIIRARQVEDSPEWRYDTPASEFALSRLEVDEPHVYRRGPDHAVEILIVTAAQPGHEISLDTGQEIHRFGRGQIFLVRPGTGYEVRSDAPATVFKATVPVPGKAASPAALADERPVFRGRQPVALVFGTSGLRGLVTEITDLEAYINTRGFLEYLFEAGDLAKGGPVSVGGDLRPSSDSPERSILRAVVRAIQDTGLVVDNLGRLPTPALTYYAMQHQRPSIMVTGSHIPFDRNGLKFNKRAGEILKTDEPAILRAVQRVRRIEYSRPEEQSPFDHDAMFKPEWRGELPPVNPAALQAYLDRYRSFLAPGSLRGRRVVFYQHSAVGRDLLVELLTALGAEVIPMERSDSFVPIDTEAISADTLRLLQDLADQAQPRRGPIDAILSTDGDSDRPLVAGIDAQGKVCFRGGDLLGILVAEFLRADTVVVPISANDAVDLWAAQKDVAVLKTKIGSPYVIEGMERAHAGGGRRVVGWEANGGFLTATDISRDGRILKALPTRDAALPLLAVLCSAQEQSLPVVGLFEKLPRRFSKAGLIDNFPPETSRALIRRFSPPDREIEQVEYGDSGVRVRRAGGPLEQAVPALAQALQVIRRDFQECFAPVDGFDQVLGFNTLDGVRAFFRNGDIVHVRPSGNAPQLRAYAVANTPERADAIVALALRESNGILRRLERSVTAATGQAASP